MWVGLVREQGGHTEREREKELDRKEGGEGGSPSAR